MKKCNFNFKYKDGVCINKLMLKNFYELQNYVDEFIKNTFVAIVKENKLKFVNDSEVEIIIE